MTAQHDMAYSVISGCVPVSSYLTSRVYWAHVFIYASFRAVASAFWAFLSSRHSSALYCFYCIVYVLMNKISIHSLIHSTLLNCLKHSTAYLRQYYRRDRRRYVSGLSACLCVRRKVKAAHTRLPSVGFRSWSRFLAVSLQVTWVINPAAGCGGNCRPGGK